jgi:hypothetical protein
MAYLYAPKLTGDGVTVVADDLKDLQRRVAALEQVTQLIIQSVSRGINAALVLNTSVVLPNDPQRAEEVQQSLQATFDALLNSLVVMEKVRESPNR